MPAIVHLQARFMASGGSGELSATAIALIVVLGLVPALVLLWVAVWLICFYGNDRNCCCMKRKRRAAVPETLEQKDSSDISQETLNEKAVYDVPQRPFAAHARTESGSSSGSGRMSRTYPNRPSFSQVDTRMSGYSQASANTLQAVQEPQRFV